jgi:hypothetical protein
MHRFCFGASIRDKCPPKATAGAASSEYALSKACQILPALELTRRFSFSSCAKIRGFATEPGLVRTKIGRHDVPAQWKMELEYLLLGPFSVKTTDQGCSSTFYCALAPLEQLGSDDACYYYYYYYYYANCQPKKPKSSSTNLQHAQKLRQLYLPGMLERLPTNYAVSGGNI